MPRYRRGLRDEPENPLPLGPIQKARLAQGMKAGQTALDLHFVNLPDRVGAQLPSALASLKAAVRCMDRRPAEDPDAQAFLVLTGQAAGTM